GFPHVAAEAAGVPKEVFDNWLKKAEKRGTKAPYCAFGDAVRTAVAQARLAAEMKAFQDDPIAWLKSGPGKERPGAPGWTTTIKPPPARLLFVPRLNAALRGISVILPDPV